MGLERYRLLAQIGAGRDGVAYRAWGPGGAAPVEVWDLSGARADAGRWEELSRRLTLVARLDHPAVVRLRELDLDQDPPFIVLDGAETDRFERPSVRSPMATREALEQARDWAGALAAAHRLGLVHGALGPGALRGTGPGDWKIDFTGAEIRTEAPDEPASRLERSCQAPEVCAGAVPDAASDVYSLAALMSWLLNGSSAGTVEVLAHGSSGEWAHLAASLDELLRSMRADEPSERPTAREVACRLDLWLNPTDLAPTELDLGPPDSTTVSAPAVPVIESTVTEPARPSASQATAEFAPQATADLAPVPPTGPLPDRLGRFRLLEKLGQGGMGDVYRGEDEADGGTVAVKVLRPQWAGRPGALQRFRKEARLLAEVNNPFVTNLLEVNEDRGFHYLVLEFVAGLSLDRWLAARGRLDEPTALAVMADVARGLADAHRLGVVHRDVKPSNILLVDRPPPASGREAESARPHGPGAPAPPPRVKLSDFGLARHAVEDASSVLTQSGVIVGTPSYMAPEQCSGRAVGPATDVYAMGATLYHLLAGRPPFEAEDWRGVITQHLNEPPTPLRKLRPDVSEGVGAVLEKALAKAPEARYADAEALLRDLERLLRGEPTAIPMHPVLPACDPRDLLEFDFEWELDAPPRRLWPLVANTDRLDRALGFGAVSYTLRFEPGRGVRRFTEGRKSGMLEVGEELPYEWVEGRRLSVFREYGRGPFRWVASIVELAPRGGGGTTLRHRLRIEPRGRLIRLGARWGVGSRLRRDLERVYRRIDASLTGRLGRGEGDDPFEPPPALLDPQRRRLERLLATLVERGNEPAVVERLGRFLAQAPGPEVARIRPLALARRLGLQPGPVVAACLHGAREGLLLLLWDIICPACRIPSSVQDTLRALEEHARCEACHAEFKLDFADSVELIFRVHPQVREADTRTYCAAGPAHSPHVIAQVRVLPGERLELDLDLAEGAYRLRGPQLAWSSDFRVRPGAPARRWDLSLTRGPLPGSEPVLGVGGQVIALANEGECELVARVERAAPRDDALTAARASSLAVFRDLFPAEVLAPGRLVSVSTVTLLVTELDRPGRLYEELGDARAFAALHEYFRLLDDVIRREGGALVKTVGEGVLASFGDPTAAVRAGLGLPDALAGGEATRDLRLRAAVHAGPAMAATINEQLDYFGTSVYLAARALRAARGGELVLTRAVAGDPPVAGLLQARGLEGQVRASDSPGHSFGPLLVLSVSPAPTAATA